MMEMRTIVPLLVIAVIYCFEPVTSNCIRDGTEGTKQAYDAVPSCLQKAMAESNTAVDGVIKFLCSHIKYKDATNKEELIQEIENLEEVTGCSTNDIIGSNSSLEQVALDENGVLTRQIITMEQLLKCHVIPPITASVCAFLNSIEKSSNFDSLTSKGKVQGNKRTTRDLLNLVGGLTGGLGGLGGLLKLLGLVGKLLNLLDPIITLLGNLLDGLGGVTNLVGGVGDTVGGLTGLLGGLTGSVGEVTQGLGGLTGGLTGGLLGGGSGGSNLLGLLGR